MNTVYKVNFFSAYINSFKIFIKHLLKNICFYIVTLLLFLIALIPNILIKYLVLIVVIIAVVPIYLVGLFDYSMYLFDQSINKDKYPELYKKGLYGNKKERQKNPI